MGLAVSSSSSSRRTAHARHNTRRGNTNSNKNTNTNSNKTLHNNTRIPGGGASTKWNTSIPKEDEKTRSACVCVHGDARRRRKNTRWKTRQSRPLPHAMRRAGGEGAGNDGLMMMQTATMQDEERMRRRKINVTGNMKSKSERRRRNCMRTMTPPISAFGNMSRRNARDVRVFGRIQGDTKEKWWEKEDGLENVATVTSTENFIEQLVRIFHTYLHRHVTSNSARACACVVSLSLRYKTRMWCVWFFDSELTSIDHRYVLSQPSAYISLIHSVFTRTNSLLWTFSQHGADHVERSIRSSSRSRRSTSRRSSCSR